MNRRRVRAPRSYGWGQPAVTFALWWQLVFGLMSLRPSGTLIGGAILVAGLVVMLVGQLAGGGRNHGGTP